MTYNVRIIDGMFIAISKVIVTILSTVELDVGVVWSLELLQAKR
jgi:hypothetical protein